MPALVQLLVLIIVAVFVLWAVSAYVVQAMPQPLKNIILAITALILILVIVHFSFPQAGI